MNFSFGSVQKFIRPRLNKGSHYLKHLVCLSLYGQGGNHSQGQPSKMTEFRNKHGITTDQFIGLTDVLGGDLQAIKAVSGAAYDTYLTHLDYKLRTAGFASRNSVEETWNHLSLKYAGIFEAVEYTPERIAIMKEIGEIFANAVNGSPNFSTVSEATVSKILSRLNSYEQKILKETTDAGIRAEIDLTFSKIKEDLKSNPTVFLIDTITWIDGVLRRAGLESILKFTSEGRIKTLPAPTDSAITKLRKERSHEYIEALNTEIGTSIRRYNADIDGRVLLINNEGNLTTYKNIYQYLAGFTGACSIYDIVLGVGSVPTIFGFTVSALYFYKKHQSYMGYSHEQVSHVYLRDDNGRSVLDVILQKNGEVTKVLENVPANEVSLHYCGNTEISLGGKHTTLGAAKNSGLVAPTFQVLKVQGSNYFIPTGYAANTELLQRTGIILA